MRKLVLLFFPLIILACKGDGKKATITESTAVSQEKKNADEWKNTSLGIDLEALKDSIDFNMDITTLSLSDVRLLRNALAARQGYCFMKADLRAIFSTTSWYNKRMEDRYWAEEEGDKIKPISYSGQEQEFLNKLLKRETELLKQNFLTRDGRKVANTANIVNLFQLKETDQELLKMLDKNGFVIVPNSNIQFFHLYEQNDYQQFPHFVTTDMFMQLFHMYFGYLLRTIEEEKFIPALTRICQHMITYNKNLSDISSGQDIKSIADFNATYYAIALTLLTGEKVAVPNVYEKMFNQELSKVESQRDATSEFLDYRDVEFPYSLFKPRGHYTRSEKMKRYFRSMTWLQVVPFCLDNDLHLKRAIMSAVALVDPPAEIKEMPRDYKAIMDPVSFIIGMPDNVSFLQLAELIGEQKWKMQELYDPKGSLGKFRKAVKELADAQNRIKPKVALSCVDKINFIPQRYLSDNEILQELIDVESSVSKRPYPKGLDVMAALGSASAENILMNELDEDKKWNKYAQLLAAMKGKMKEIDWNATLYNKWMESLLKLQQTKSEYPSFMQTSAWDKKNLNSSLASWAELKHDAILYAEQPMAAECGDGGPPAPYTVAYVEPNIGYWETVNDLISMTTEMLEKNNLSTDDIRAVTERLKENAEFLLNISKKELSGVALSEQEYQQIEYIGSTFEWITLSLVKEKDQYLDGWDNVKGPDRSVAVVADIYTSNANNNPEKGILHVATGNVNDIYVVVEIEGYLYLTKGAVFSYYEFPMPLNTRLTDEEWQKMLNKRDAPKIPDWLKEIILDIKPPESNEKIFYSSGC
ncbi:MAG: DUF3160 domain-containing protein [Bacteroidales bacterium]|nr:DUF3160 domain-containing protein [Bacteroidales bacterium]